MDRVREKCKLLPENPGVYMMLDKDGIVIYVGKARVLKNRVRQYFHSSEKPQKVMAMVENIADFHYVITSTEADALSLENTLIKKYKPKYNILLKDDKTYPYIKVHTKEDFPRFSITRRITKEGKYYGPFMGGIRCKDILEILSLVYSVRSCQVAITDKPKKPCLLAHLSRCLSPCSHACSKEEYAGRVKSAMRFLEGEYEEAEGILSKKMQEFADREEFELAMEYREKLSMLAKLKEKRITTINRCINADVIAYTTNNLYSSASVLIMRGGIMQGVSQYALEDAHSTPEEGLTAFVAQYYNEHDIPEEIILPSECEQELLEEYFAQKTNKKPILTFAKQGVKRKLLAMAQTNANEYLQKNIDKIKHKNDMTKKACERLQELLGLSSYPKRMECYDVSNISGVDKVGSMVVFYDGEADRQSYRRFRIKTVEGANDYASHQEVMKRRLSKLGTEEEERFPRPNLVIIDGGKGQLSAVKEIFDEMGVQGIDLIALAEREEQVFTLNSSESVKIDRHDYVLKMLQRIRDEAHRFAITYFRTLHNKRNLDSILSEIKGLGKQKRMALMQELGTIDRIKNASVEELCKVKGIGEELALRIYHYCREHL